MIKFLSIIFLFIISVNLYSQNTDEYLKFNAYYTGDKLNNVGGGISKGSMYIGMANFKTSFDTEKAGLWSGGQAYVNAVNTHGGMPTKQYVGEMQTVSNIQAGNHTFIQELWYMQSIDKVDIIVGLQDINALFAASAISSFFVNSSFGIHPTISTNIPAPVFPLTNLGASVRWRISDEYTIQTALYDGSPTSFENNEYNLNWNINQKDGYLAITEFQSSHKLFGDNNSTLKLGGFYHNHLISTSDSGAPDTAFEKNYGAYFVYDQTLISDVKGEDKLAMFVQASASPKSHNSNYSYLGLGVNYKGLIRSRENDVAGIALASANLNRLSSANETVLELSYKVVLSDKIFIQPDFQYIISPAGAEVKVDNACIAIVRFGIHLQ